GGARPVVDAGQAIDVAVVDGGGQLEHQVLQVAAAVAPDQAPVLLHHALARCALGGAQVPALAVGVDVAAVRGDAAADLRLRLAAEHRQGNQDAAGKQDGTHRASLAPAPAGGKGSASRIQRRVRND